MRLTKLKHRKKWNQGFTLTEVMVALALIAIFAYMVSSYTSAVNRNAHMNRSNNTKNRILAGVRDLAAMPASLRASMRASSGSGAVNPELLACAGGNPVNSCKNGIEVPFTLYGPLIQRHPTTGAVMGAPVISSPLGSTTNPVRVDTFGAPCPLGSPASKTCPLLVETAFKAQCGPPNAAAATPAVELAPTATCTVADVIEVMYYVRLDSSIQNTDPGLASFVTPISGSVVVPVAAISGNVPQ